MTSPPSERKEAEGIVERWLLIPKGIFVFMSLAYYCVYTFRELFLNFYLGLTGIVGWFGAVFAVFTFFGGFFWAKISDITGDYTTPLALSACLACLAFYGMYFLEFGTSATLWISLVCFSVSSFCISAFQPLTDALVLRLIPDKDTYGRQRLFLPLTYGFITTVMVLICQRFGWIAVFPAMSLLNIMFISFIFLAVKNPPISDSLRQARLAANRPGGGGVQVPGFWALFRLKRFLFVMVIVFFIGFVRGTFTVFLSGYLKNVVGIPLGMASLTPLAGLSMEIPIFFYGKDILNFLGVDYCLLLALFCGLVRIVSYLVLSGIARKNPGHDITYGVFVCLIELLKGPSFALTHSAAIKIVMSETPEILHGRAQALYAGIFNCLSAFASSMVGQLILSIYKAKDSDSDEVKKNKVYKSGNAMFALAALITLVTMVLSVVRMVIARRGVAKGTPGDSQSADVDGSQPLISDESSKKDYNLLNEEIPPEEQEQCQQEQIQKENSPIENCE